MSSTKIDNFFQDILSFNSDEEHLEFKTNKLQLDIVSKIITIMKERELTQKELAKKIDITPSYLSQIFSADKPLNLKTITKIEEALNIKTEFNFSQNRDKVFNKRSLSYNFNNFTLKEGKVKEIKLIKPKKDKQLVG